MRFHLGILIGGASVACRRREAVLNATSDVVLVLDEEVFWQAQVGEATEDGCGDCELGEFDDRGIDGVDGRRIPGEKKV